MLALFYKKINTSKYENDISQILSYKIKCNCGVSGSCIKYGTYKRKVSINSILKEISLQRIYCKSCGITHTIMPSFIIPYKNIGMEDYIEICEVIENEKNLPSDTKKTLENFLRWKKRINELKMKIRDDLEEVISFCSLKFRMCIFQEHKRNYLRKGKLFEVEYILIQPPT